MPAAGRSDGKYVKKVHWPWFSYTLCGKRIPDWALTTNREDVTCKTCRRMLNLSIEDT